MCIFLSDISGAFDRVATTLLLSKCQCAGVGNTVLNFLRGYLQPRHASVVVDGCCSDLFELADTVFQGTVLGPPLWNVYYSDASDAIRKHDFQETVFADDLNCFRVFDESIGDDYIFSHVCKCQTSLHEWGAANQVIFEPTKESMHIY